jgi:hypothetical protein
MLVGFGSFTCSTFAIAAATTALPLVAGACFDEKSPFDPTDWSYCKKISSNHELYMYYTPLEDTVLLGFHALQDTNGWTALAISGNGGMKGATFYVVRQDDDGSWIAEDRYAMEYAMPTLDEQQDIKLLFAEQDNGQTAWGVAIPQTWCDTKGNDYDIVDRTTSMLWAVGSGHDFGFHVQRGQFEVNLLQAPHEPFDIDASGLSTFEVRMPNVNVVMGDGGTDEMNPYICSYFDLKEIGASAGFSPDEVSHNLALSPV